MSLIIVKRLVLLLIALLEVVGLILIGYGIFFLYTAKPGEEFAGGFLIILGSITMILAIFGFLAAIREAPVGLLMYLGVLALMIRIQVMSINFASGLQHEIKEKIQEASSFKPILVPNLRAISELEILMEWLGVIKTVCWLIILVELNGAVFAVLLYRRVKRSRLAENPVPTSQEHPVLQ